MQRQTTRLVDRTTAFQLTLIPSRRRQRRERLQDQFSRGNRKRPLLQDTGRSRFPQISWALCSHSKSDLPWEQTEHGQTFRATASMETDPRTD